jgi:holo-[acyl-carrier protein] synthase
MGIAWKDMVAVTNLTGQPVMGTGWAAQRLADMTPAGHEAIIHVTLTRSSLRAGVCRHRSQTPYQ